MEASDMRMQRGLSFLEIVISVTILTIVFFVTYQIFVTGYRFYKTTQNSTTLTKYAQQQLEVIAAQRSAVSTQWINFPQDTSYRYSLTVTNYTQPSFPTGYYDGTGEGRASYNIYAISLMAQGPLDANGETGSMTRTIVLKTVVAPSQDFFPQKSELDENIHSGATNIWIAR